MIDWIPIKELVITPEMENEEVLLYLRQVKLVSRTTPDVIVADIIDGEVSIPHHLYDELDLNKYDLSFSPNKPPTFGLAEVTHYAWKNIPDE